MTALVNPYRVLADSAAMRADAATDGSLFGRLVGWVREHHRYRRTLNELAALSTRELDDIGLRRQEIEDVARRSARIV
ncbi:MAG: DUF1127 domain-containing protein [Geminicoccaceae bacterium]